MECVRRRRSREHLGNGVGQWCEWCAGQRTGKWAWRRFRVSRWGIRWRRSVWKQRRCVWKRAGTGCGEWWAGHAAEGPAHCARRVATTDSAAESGDPAVSLAGAVPKSADSAAEPGASADTLAGADPEPAEPCETRTDAAESNAEPVAPNADANESLFGFAVAGSTVDRLSRAAKLNTAPATCDSDINVLCSVYTYATMGFSTP